MPPLGVQIAWLFLLALPIACVTWTVTHEELFREPREFCVSQSQDCRRILPRKFFYVFTCEYCFSHYVATLFVIFTRYHLLLPNWRGYVIAAFSLIWIANFYIGVFGRLRLEIKHERIEVAKDEKRLDNAN